MTTKPLKWHVNKLGLSNVFIQDFVFRCLSSESEKRRFMGVFEDTKLIPLARVIAKKQKEEKNELALIANVGAHFVTLIVGKKYILHIDSFGLPAVNAKVKKLVSELQASKLDKRLKPKFYRNTNRIQSFTSTHCGLYAVLYCLKYLLPQQFMDIRLHFSPTNFEKNDALCVKYLKKFLEKI